MKDKQMKWIDTHAHFSDGGKFGSVSPEFLKNIMKVFNSSNIDLHFVAIAEFYSNVSFETIIEGNKFIRDMSQLSCGKIHGSCCVNPNYLDESLRLMEAAFEKWGFIQLGEMLQYMMDYNMSDPGTERLVRKAVEYDVPIHVHISTSNAKQHPSSFGEEQLLDLFKLVERIPEGKYILAHFVGTMKDDPPVVDDYLELIRKEYGKWPDNFWMEVHGFNSPGLKSALDFVPVERILSGTDWVPKFGPPYPAYGTIFEHGIAPEEHKVIPINKIVDILADHGLTKDDIENIAHKNAEKLYKLI